MGQIISLVDMSVLCQYHAILISIVLKYTLKTSNLILPGFPFFLNFSGHSIFCDPIQALWILSINISVKNDIGGWQNDIRSQSVYHPGR